MGAVATYHARARVGHLALEGDPLVVGSLLVGEGPQEGPADVVHGVETHGRALEHATAGPEGQWSDTY